MDSSDASQLAVAPPRRFANNGRLYTRREFLDHYGAAGERRWAEAEQELVHAPQLPHDHTDGVGEPDRRVVAHAAQSPNAAASSCSDTLTARTITRDAAQLPACSADAGPRPEEPDLKVVGQPAQSPDAAASSASGCLTARATNRDAAQLPAASPNAGASSVSVTLAARTTTRDVAQLPAGSADARLRPEQVIAIQQEEAARGPPRSLHTLARDALNAISNRPTRDTVNLDECFPWVQYVAAHRQSAEIIGPGITHAHAVFLPNTNDANRGGAPRLDFCFYRTDNIRCRVHPGRRPRDDAQLVFDHYL